MVQRVVELGAKLKATFLTEPIEKNHFRKREIQICLPRTVYDPCPAVTERCPDAIRANHWGSGETRRVEIVVQFRFDRSSRY